MESSGFSHELEVAIRLARRAGEVILRHYATNFAVDYKDEDATDPVTQADRDANNIIVAGLAAAFPADAILAEESAASPTRHGHRRLWCVDPVDGTREFVDHNGQFAVMIGLAVEGVAEVGVIYQPTEDHLAYGAAGRAVSVLRGEERPLHVSKQAHPAHATLMVSRSHRSRSVQRVAQDLNIARQEPLGSVGLKILRLAEGSADLYVSVSNQTHEWDACGPEAVLKAAGGTMTDICGEPLRYNKPDTTTPRGLLASNGLLHAACVAALRPVAAERGWFSG